MADQTSVPLTPESRDWDGEQYHEVANPQALWGNTVLERLVLRGDERVVDAGCGSGRVTASLLDRLPQGHVVAADLSPSMLAQARQTLQAYGNRVSFVEADLLNLDQVVGEPADAIFSTATLHWIDDHRRLFQAFFRALKPGGQLVAQCGGTGNLESLIRVGDELATRPPFEPYLRTLREWHHRASAEETLVHLQAAGFQDARAWLTSAPTPFSSREAFTAFVRTVVLGRHLALLPPEIHDRFVETLVDSFGAREHAWALDYVRLNSVARKP